MTTKKREKNPFFVRSPMKTAPQFGCPVVGRPAFAATFVPLAVLGEVAWFFWTWL
jgi:hypothetical protein